MKDIRMKEVTIITGVERRRLWREDEKQEILAAAFAPGAIVKDVARRFDVGTNTIYTSRWCR
jgi:transposase